MIRPLKIYAEVNGKKRLTKYSSWEGVKLDGWSFMKSTMKGVIMTRKGVILEFWQGR
jgi:hypothetical protein